MALDYRIRYYFAITPPEEMVAFRGYQILTGLYPKRPSSIPYFVELSSWLAQHHPIGKRLDLAEEAELVRYCYVLGPYEEIVRAGPFKSPLRRYPWAPATDLLALVPAPAVEDLTALSWAAFIQFESVFNTPAILNPRFDGSIDVGGADADLILDACLVDIKATVKGRLDSQWLYQLLGYVLLDYSNRYLIDEVAIYMARQQKMLRWRLDAFLRAMGNGQEVALDEVREHFHAVAVQA